MSLPSLLNSADGESRSSSTNGSNEVVREKVARTPQQVKTSFGNRFAINQSMSSMGQRLRILNNDLKPLEKKCRNFNSS
jgi:hypothetical protein